MRLPEVPWESIEFFHLDEYIDISEEHPASFRRYLRKRIVDKVHPKEFHLICGDCGNPESECRRLNSLISSVDIDLTFLGIGENGHIAFNDPPADFEIESPYIIVNLDETCRRQQLGEGWFQNLESVPKRAISMSVRQILKSKKILCIVSEERKAKAVRNCLDGRIAPEVPSSILHTHRDTTLFLDAASASLLEPDTVARYRSAR